MKTPIDLMRKMHSDVLLKRDDVEHYPTLFLEWDREYNLPESGTMEVKFVRRSVTTKEKKDGSVHQSVELDIVSIEKVKAGPVEEKPEKKTGEVLDEAVMEYQADDED